MMRVLRCTTQPTARISTTTTQTSQLPGTCVPCSALFTDTLLAAGGLFRHLYHPHLLPGVGTAGVVWQTAPHRVQPHAWTRTHCTPTPAHPCTHLLLRQNGRGNPWPPLPVCGGRSCPVDCLPSSCCSCQHMPGAAHALVLVRAVPQRDPKHNQNHHLHSHGCVHACWSAPLLLRPAPSP